MLLKILLLLFFFSACSTSLKTKALQDGENIIIQEELNLSPLGVLQKQKGLPFVKHEIKTTHYFLFTRTFFHFQVGASQPESLPEEIPLQLVALFRGKALKHNAQEIKENKAIWHFRKGDILDAHLETYAFEPLPAFFVLALYLVFLSFRKAFKNQA